MSKSAASKTLEISLPLFYKLPLPLDKNAHAKHGLKANFGFSFSKDVNAVPVNVIEMPQLCHFYPIAFSPNDEATPVAILGLRDNENLFVGKDGMWEANTYIPAYVRRYPFIFSEIQGMENRLSLCVDMNKDVVSEDGEQKFFDDKGNQTTLLNNAMEFCKSYHAAAQQTIEFGKVLSASGLLIEREAQIVSGNARINFKGFRIIDEPKLAQLPEKEFLKLRPWLPFIYAHTFSGAQWPRLTALLTARMQK